MPKKKTDLSKRSRSNRKHRSSKEQIEKHRLQARLYYKKRKEEAQQEGLKIKRKNTSSRKSNFLHESKEKRQQRLQKMCEAQAVMRSKETEEARENRLKNAREQVKLRRLSESQDERDLRLAKERVRVAYFRYMKSKCNLTY